jgi:hypothetical protein
MRKTILAVAAMMALAGCTTAETDTAAGGLIGAGVGGAVGGWEGAAIGGAIGAGTGYFLGRATRQGWCRYRDRHGRIYEARCR